MNMDTAPARAKNEIINPPRLLDWSVVDIL